MPRTAMDVLHDARQADRLNEYYQWFTETYRPKVSPEDRRDLPYRFDGDLMQLMRLIYEDAQRPFAYELSLFRERALVTSALAPTIVTKEKP